MRNIFGAGRCRVRTGMSYVLSHLAFLTQVLSSD
jgi:hypothetical protein